MSKAAAETAEEVLAPDVSHIITEDDVVDADYEVEAPDISHIITEDDTPVDNIVSAKQQRLLVESLYGGWKPGEVFLAETNVGLFSSPKRPPVVPDVFVSLGVEPARDWWEKRHRSYFLWEFAKPPEIVIEIVSNKKGRERTRKMEEYARIGVGFYVIYDQQRLIQKEELAAFVRLGAEYHPMPEPLFGKLGLRLVIWNGVYEGRNDAWLRWAKPDGTLIPTGREAEKQRADAAERRATAEKKRASAEKQRANAEKQRAGALAARLRAAGIDPDAP